MNKFLFALLVLLASPSTGVAQGGIVTNATGSSDPTGSCTAPGGSNLALYTNTNSHKLWWCNNTNSWELLLSTSNVGVFAWGGTAGPLATGTAASRPSCSSAGYYLASDTHALTACDGTNWSGTLNPAGSYSIIFNSTAGAVQVYNSSGANVLPSGAAVPCSTGSIPYTSLTTAGPSQEITIQTGVLGSTRWDHVLVSETTQFTGTTGLTVSMGRPGANDMEMTGALVPLMVSSGDANYLAARPIPPQLSGTYSIVLNFAVSSGNVNAATAGSLTWEVCGYAAH